MSDYASLLRETEEAIGAGQEAHRQAQQVLDSLRSARGWGIYDLLGGGMLSGLMKHSRMDRAQQQLESLRQALERFNRELKVKVMKDADGLITQGLVVDESDYDHVALIVASNKGDFKDYPVLGVGERYLKSVGRAAEMRADVQTQLELDGYNADVQVSDTGELVIDTK